MRAPAVAGLKEALMSKIAAEVIVETLQSAGVKRCYGVVGDTLNYVTDAMRRSTIEWVHLRHEEVGDFAAGAEAMLTGSDRVRGLVRSGKPALHQRPVRIAPQSRSGRADREPSHQRRSRVRFSARS